MNYCIFSFIIAFFSFLVTFQNLWNLSSSTFISSMSSMKESFSPKIVQMLVEAHVVGRQTKVQRIYS